MQAIAKDVPNDGQYTAKTLGLIMWGKHDCVMRFNLFQAVRGAFEINDFTKTRFKLEISGLELNHVMGVTIA